MLFDFYFIILTAFAILGLFFVLETVMMHIQSLKAPRSVTIIKYSKDKNTNDKIKYIYDNIPNNEIVYLSENKEDGIIPRFTNCEISSYLSNVLFTNSDC